MDTEKLEVNSSSPSDVDTGSDADVRTTGAETIDGKSSANVLVFSFPDMISLVKVFGTGTILYLSSFSCFK